MEERGAVEALKKELERSHPDLAFRFHYLPIDNPRDYEALYRGMRAVCEKVRTDLGANAEFNFLLSPGTPQMHAIWLLLAKTVFPAATWQASDQPGEAPAERIEIPFDIDAELLEPVRQECTKLLTLPGQSDLVVESEAMRRVIEMALRAAQTDEQVLLLGEHGVGKEVVARTIHQASGRRNRPFRPINCAAIPASLAESELFGYERGAFSGATRDRQGFFEAASGGTVLLDEVGDLPPDLQVKLLRVLQEHTVRRVGSPKEIAVDVRVIAATNKDLKAATNEGRFREDLFYRLNVIPITIPPLRERRQDIGPLADRFMTTINKERSEKSLSKVKLMPSARQRLYSHGWPGNVRELENCLRQLSAVSSTGRIDQRVVENALPPVTVTGTMDGVDFTIGPGRGLKEVLCDIERRILEEAWKQQGSQARAAKALGLGSQQAFQKRFALLQNGTQP